MKSSFVSKVCLSYFDIFWPLDFIQTWCETTRVRPEDSTFSVWPLIVAIVLGIIGLAVLYKFSTSMDRTSGLFPFEIQKADSSLVFRKRSNSMSTFFVKAFSMNFPSFTSELSLQATKHLQPSNVGKKNHWIFICCIDVFFVLFFHSVKP